MFIETLHTEGFPGLSPGELSFSRLTTVRGSPRALTSLGDALLLAASAWDEAALRTLLLGWGAEAVEPLLGKEGLPEGARWAKMPGTPGPPLRVSLTVRLDPPLFGRLRKAAVKQSALVDGLSADATMTLKVGARFAEDAVAVDLVGLSVGGTSFPVAGADRPAWLPDLLRALSGRIARGGLPLGLWGERASRWDLGSQRGLQKVLSALSRAPLSLGEAALLPGGPGIFTDAGVVPLQRFGPAAVRAAEVAGAVFLSGAEILVLPEVPPGRGWVAWLREQAEAEGSPLEQLILLGIGGGLDIA